MAKNRKDSPVIFDIESHYNTESGYSLAKMSTAEYVNDLQSHVYLMGAYDMYDHEYHVAEHNDIPHLLAEIDYKNRIMVAHNNKFDASMMKFHWGVMPRVALCTQLMAQYVLGSPSKLTPFRKKPGGTNQLKELQTYYGLQSGRKLTENLAFMDGKYDMQGIGETHRRDMFDYQERDVMICAELFMLLYKLVPKVQFYTIDWAIRQFADPILELIPSVFADVVTEQALEMDDLLLQLGVDLKSLRSVGKFSQLLIDAGMAKDELPTKVSGTGNTIYAFAKNDPGFHALQHHKIERVRQLSEARVAAQSSILRTRAEKYLAVARATGNKWPVDIIPSGAHTHRPTGADGGGGNPLNLPRPPKVEPDKLHGSQLRKGIVAPSGYYLLYFDYTAIELRICRWGAKDEAAIMAIMNGEDVYKTLAAVIFRIEYDDVDDDQRWVAKQLQLALQYGVSAKAMHLRMEQAGRFFELQEVEAMVYTFRKSVHRAIPKAWQTCQAIIDAWAKGVTNPTFYEQMQDRLNIPGAITSEGIRWPSGRLLAYPNVVQKGDRDVFYHPRGLQYEPKKIYGASLLENIAQSLANEIIDEKQKTIERELGFRVPLQVYDSLTMVVPNEVPPKDAAALVREVACEPVSWWADQPPLDIEMAAGRTYYDCK